MSKELRINILGYDYSGYGCSTGTPSVSNTIADINACYQFLLQTKGKRPQDIVVYGQSVGSGPSCDLGAAEPDLKGLVLHSPLMSGMITMTNVHSPAWLDVQSHHFLTISFVDFEFKALLQAHVCACLPMAIAMYCVGPLLGICTNSEDSAHIAGKH